MCYLLVFFQVVGPFTTCKSTCAHIYSTCSESAIASIDTRAEFSAVAAIAYDLHPCYHADIIRGFTVEDVVKKCPIYNHPCAYWYESNDRAVWGEDDIYGNHGCRSSVQTQSCNTQNYHISQVCPCLDPRANHPAAEMTTIVPLNSDEAEGMLDDRVHEQSELSERTKARFEELPVVPNQLLPLTMATTTLLLMLAILVVLVLWLVRARVHLAASTLEGTREAKREEDVETTSAI